MRRAALLALLFAPAGCSPGPEQRQTAQRNATAPEPPSPLLIRYLPPGRGGPTVFPEAQVSGVLDLTGPCVRLQDHRGGMWTIVSSAGPVLGSDHAGLYVQSGKERLRHGSSITGGGGWFTSFPGGLGPLERPLPQACSSERYVVVTGVRRFDPADEPLPQSPPPPPSG